MDVFANATLLRYQHSVGRRRFIPLDATAATLANVLVSQRHLPRILSRVFAVRAFGRFDFIGFIRHGDIITL